VKFDLLLIQAETWLNFERQSLWVGSPFPPAGGCGCYSVEVWMEEVAEMQHFFGKQTAIDVRRA
jgi:hypothetical protein